VFTSLSEGQAWQLVLVLLSVAAGLVILALLRRLVSTRRAPAKAELPAEETLRRDLAEVSARLGRLEAAVGQIADNLPRSIQGVGVVRYNPFEQMGSNMSFSLALLDGRANGVVVSVLNNREGSRVYGKAVERGTSNYPLSDEERKALALAQDSRQS
jgi:hypothetical protein